MKKLLLGAVFATLAASPAFAVLKEGDTAPVFKTKAVQGGNEFDFSLAESLKKGPVVLYFYPGAFHPGCTIEAHSFSAAADDFKAAGVTLVGMSVDPIDKLKEFSTQECQSKFPLASDFEKTIMESYDTKLAMRPTEADRTSYVIAPNGKILYVYNALDPSKHVENTLAAVKKWNDEHPKKK